MTDPFDYLSRIPEPHQSVARRVEAAIIAYSEAHGWPKVYVVTACWPTLNAITSAARYIPFGTSWLDEPISWGTSILFRRSPNPTMPEGEFTVSAEEERPSAEVAPLDGWTVMRDTRRDIMAYLHRGGMWFQVTGKAAIQMAGYPKCDVLKVADEVARGGATGEHVIELTLIDDVMSARCVPVGSG